MDNRVRYELADGVATITLDDGKVNAMSLDMLALMHAALDRAAADNAVVVLAGSARLFSGGFDLKIFKAGGQPLVNMLTEGGRLGERLLTFPRPTVIAATGHAIAMGAVLLMCADHRVGTSGEVNVQLNETAIGLTLPYFAIALAHHRLAIGWQNRAVANAEPLPPAAAVAAGFLDETVPAGEVLATAQTRAKALAALHPEAFFQTRARLRQSLIAALHDAKQRDAAEWQALYLGQSA